MLSRISTSVQPMPTGGLVALAAHLCTQDYCTAARGRILDYVSREGTTGGLTELGYLDPGDEEAAEAAFVGGLEPVHPLDAAWDDPGIWIDADSLEAAATGWLERVIRPIRGGSPDGPTADDVAEMRRATDLEEIRDDERRLADSRSPLYGFE